MSEGKDNRLSSIIIIVLITIVAFLSYKLIKKSDDNLYSDYVFEDDEVFVAKIDLDGTPLGFGLDGDRRISVKNFSVRENGYRWMLGEHGKVALWINNPDNSDVILYLDAYLFQPEKQTVKVLLNNKKEIYTISKDVQAPCKITIPNEDIKNNIISLDFYVDKPMSPKDVNNVNDPRMLGLSFKNISLHNANFAFALDNTPILFGDGGHKMLFLKSFSYPEAAGRWTLDNTAEISFKASNPNKTDIIVELDGYLFQGDTQSVVIKANNKELLTITGDTASPYRFTIPYDVVKDDIITLQLAINNPLSPHSLGMSGDDRMLGMFVRSIKLHE